MAFLDAFKRNTAPQQPVAQAPQPQPAPTQSVQNLPDHVKAAAVEAARPSAALMEKATNPSSAPVQPQATPNALARGRSLGMER